MTRKSRISSLMLPGRKPVPESQIVDLIDAVCWPYQFRLTPTPDSDRIVPLMRRREKWAPR